MKTLRIACITLVGVFITSCLNSTGTGKRFTPANRDSLLFKTITLQLQTGVDIDVMQYRLKKEQQPVNITIVY